jgi:PAS domain S-box-containing protein
LLPESRRAEFDEYYLESIRKQGKAEGIMVAIDRNGHDVYLLYQNFLVPSNDEQPYVIGFAQDITARINAEVALKKSEEKYRGIIENMNLGMMEISVDNTVLYANNSFLEMSGYTAEELPGRKINELFFTDENVAVAKEVIERRTKGKSDAYELLVKNKKGETKWWLVSGAPKMDIDGNYLGSLGIYLDITPQKTMEIELRKAKNDAELSAYSKEMFLANMSHEIRTPMNAIIGIGRLLGKTGLAAQQKYYLDIIENASGNLLVIINDLLDFSKIEAGKVTLEHIGFSLGKITENVVHILKHKCEEKNLIIKYQCSEEIEPVLIGDPYRINQILINLIGNSIKFTDRGEIAIRCSVEKKGTKDQSILFEVEDTGIGMSEEFLSHIFDKFTQEDEGITRKFGGTGLGMSISKQLIELMGGAIEIRSLKNIGTHISFRISFPVGSKDDLPSAWNQKPDTVILHGKQILLVEDNYMNRVLARTILTQYGASITEAEDGAKAIEILRSQKFDLILMDIQMPVKDGIEATKYIRENLDTTTPIIAMTANAYKREEERCLAIGMNDFISKPFEEDKFIYQIAQWLGAATTNSVFPQHENEAVSPELFDLSKLISTSRGDKQFMEMMLEMFVTEIPNAVKELEDAAKKKDLDRLGSIAHRIRPSVLSYGISALAVSLEKLERYNEEVLDEEQSVEITRNICVILNSVVASFRQILEGKNLSDIVSSVN